MFLITLNSRYICVKFISFPAQNKNNEIFQLKVSDGDTLSAIQLYIKSNKPLSALSAANNDSVLSQDENILRQIADSLVKSQLYDKAGDVYEKLKDFDKAVEYFKKGDAYGKAIQVKLMNQNETICSGFFSLLDSRFLKKLSLWSRNGAYIWNTLDSMMLPLIILLVRLLLLLYCEVPKKS